MPPLPAVPNVIRYDFDWSISPLALISTRWFMRYSGGPPSSTDANALAADAYSAMAAQADLWQDDVAFVDVRTVDLASSSGAQGEHAQSTVGTRGTGVLNGAQCALVNYVINRRYRGGKPRSYWPWLGPQDLQTPKDWASAALTEIDSAITSVQGAIIGSSSGTTTITDHVNVSYYSGFTVVTSPTTGRAKNVPKLRTVPVVDTIVSFAAAPRVSVQRRRLGR